MKQVFKPPLPLEQALLLEKKRKIHKQLHRQFKQAKRFRNKNRDTITQEI